MILKNINLGEQKNFHGKIIYELDNQNNYEIYRDFSKKNPKIYNQYGEDISKEFTIDKNKGSEFFKEQTGIEEEMLFNTAVIEQNETELDKGQQNVIIQKLTNIISTGEDNISFKKMIEKLNKKQLEEIGTTKTTERPINIIMEKLNKLNQQKNKITEIKNQKYEIENQKEGLENQKKQLEQKIKIIKKIKNNKENESIDKEIILLNEKSIVENDKTVRDVLTNKIATIGENMSIRRFERFETNNLLESYIHGDGKIAVLVEMENGTQELAKDICMQIAAARPEYLDRESVPEERLAKEMEILKAQAMNEGKPEAIAEKIVQGRVGKFYSEICLVEQEFVKDPDIKVGKLVESKGAKIIRFARFEKGEGLEKKQENFAEEVAKQING